MKSMVGVQLAFLAGDSVGANSTRSTRTMTLSNRCSVGRGGGAGSEPCVAAGAGLVPVEAALALSTLTERTAKNQSDCVRPLRKARSESVSQVNSSSNGYVL